MLSMPDQALDPDVFFEMIRAHLGEEDVAPRAFDRLRETLAVMDALDIPITVTGVLDALVDEHALTYLCQALRERIGADAQGTWDATAPDEMLAYQLSSLEYHLLLPAERRDEHVAPISAALLEYQMAVADARRAEATWRADQTAGLSGRLFADRAIHPSP